jgi:hypothetical protein
MREHVWAMSCCGNISQVTTLLHGNNFPGWRETKVCHLQCRVNSINVCRTVCSHSQFTHWHPSYDTSLGLCTLTLWCTFDSIYNCLLFSLAWQYECKLIHINRTLSRRTNYIYTNPSTPELNPSEQRSLTRIFTGDFASWTVHFVNICVKSQQMQQLFFQFIIYGGSYMFRHYIAIFRERSLCVLRDARLRGSR